MVSGMAKLRNLYLRVIALESPGDDPSVDVAALIRVAEAYGVGRDFQLHGPPTHHPRGGYALHVWLRPGGEPAWIEHLAERGWSSVF